MVMDLNKDFRAFLFKSVGANSTPMDRSWGVVIAQPRSELKAIINLTKQGYECYCPMVRERLVHKCKVSHIERALFPRYLFVHIVGIWRSILGTFGVSSLILDGEVPALLDSEIITDLKSRESPAGFIALPDERARFKRGAKVRVRRGPFRGSLALVEGMSSDERVLVLMRLLGRETRIELDADDLSEEDALERLREKFKAGREVVIEHGPFQGARALVEKVFSHGRVIVLMSVLGQETRVEVAAGDLVIK